MFNLKHFSLKNKHSLRLATHRRGDRDRDTGGRGPGVGHPFCASSTRWRALRIVWAGRSHARAALKSKNHCNSRRLLRA